MVYSSEPMNDDEVEDDVIIQLCSDGDSFITRQCSDGDNSITCQNDKPALVSGDTKPATPTPLPNNRLNSLIPFLHNQPLILVISTCRRTKTMICLMYTCGQQIINVKLECGK